jgi:TetR/AcrR family transcriptional regulator, transcriptional repressor for nem operon
MLGRRGRRWLRKSKMRFVQNRKKESHHRIVRVAVEEFRKRGVESVSVAEIMKRAGLTHGGFYSHFRSKEKLVTAALDESFNESRRNIARERKEGKSIEQFIRDYLSIEHRDHPETGCSVALLTGEVARQARKVRANYASALGESISTIAAFLLPSLDSGKRKESATAIYAILVGTLQMARAVPDPTISSQILEAGISAACSLAHSPSYVFDQVPKR